MESITSYYHVVCCSVQHVVAGRLQSTTKQLYDLAKLCEETAGATAGVTASDALPELIVAGFDDEQIWQQIELQNEPVLSRLIGGVSHALVDRGVFEATGGASKEGDGEEEGEEERGEEEEEEEEEEEGAEEAGEEDEDEEERGLFGDDDSGTEDSEEEELKRLLDKVTAKLPARTSDDESAEELARPDDDEDDYCEDDREDNHFRDDRPGERMGNAKTGWKSEVDDRFFKLSAMEAFLDQEDAREEAKIRREKSGKGEEEEEEEEDNIDMFAEDDEVSMM